LNNSCIQYHDNFVPWASEKDLQNHAELVATKGYAATATGPLKNELNNFILQNLNH